MEILETEERKMNKNTEKKQELTLLDLCYYISYYFTSLPQIHSILIINDLYLYGTKMFPQIE